MTEERVERRLAAILAADVAGYSRLMGKDEAGTLSRLKTLRRELIDPRIAEHKGRIVKTIGDGLLVEFPSVVGAVHCAVEIQRGIADRNMSVATERRIEFRIGIHQGDIIVEDGDIFGEGVNIAARLEGLADPGGICVSDRVQSDAVGKIDVGFDDLGPQQIKNIARPVHVYRVRLDKSSETPSLALPDKPSIAVLPFQNMSGDPEQEYFADGMVEEIITALARIRWLFVIARNSSFTYKGQAVDVKRVGRELGVRYVLEGALADRALELNPSFARGWYISGILRMWAGQPDITLRHLEAALRLSPRARIGSSLVVIGQAHFFAQRFGEAAPKLLLAIQEDPSSPQPYRDLAACYTHMGRLNEAREIVRRLRAVTPAVITDITYLRDPGHRNLFLSGLRVATGEAE